ncbi:nitrogen assimilation transcription factor nit-4 [Fusarium solani]|uniref:Nitrogen assimilation transcription factor nit-4 n=1 Tax=Fusarium solani TaxID=169388 RepID=A0A9P9GIM4_FUSSL|nr:nitrogen assimilation transcription factor nit-4 [Fusarium solani]KAH7239631.1 nitrogen assimilation transcription factor nit-4 [Fusarium solani]
MHFGDANQPDGRDLTSMVTGLLGRLNVGDDGQLHYFGSQCNFHLLHGSLGYVTMESTVSMQRQGLAAVGCLGKDMPLSTELQEHLLELYWTWQNPWNYIVHKGAFSRAFHSRTYGRYCTPSLLSAIFALAARYSDRRELRAVPNDPSTAGYALFEQAKILLLYESQAPTVATVQAAALMAIRALSDNQEALGWLYCGNAARMALSLGLHIDCSQWVASGLISQDEAEVRKVTWWGCYTVDKLFSIALGRPGCTRKSQSTCPKPSLDHDAEYEAWVQIPGLTQDNSLPVLQSRIVSTAHFIAECLSIASEAMDQIYAPNSGLSQKDIENIVGKTDVELRAYYVNLPSHLRLPSTLRTSAPAHIYQLHMQYHVNIILLHRPLLQQYPNISESDPTSVCWESPHRKDCRAAASEVSKLLGIYKQNYTFRFAGMVTVHVAFTAATIHLIDLKPESNPYRQQAMRGLATCVEALEAMKTPWCAWSSKALRAIYALAEEWSMAEVLEMIPNAI